MKCEANCFKKEKVFFGPHMFMFDVKRFLRYCGFLKNFGVFILVYFFFLSIVVIILGLVVIFAKPMED